jgi:GTP pyrophosphokinase
VAGGVWRAAADDLFAMVGYGKVTARAVLGAASSARTPCTEKSARRRADVRGQADAGIGRRQRRSRCAAWTTSMVFRARCCNPIRGEKIVGYITAGKACPCTPPSARTSSISCIDPDRRIDVEWDKTADASPYSVRLRISVADRRGILADVSSRISDINTNIRDVEATVDDGQRGSIRMTVTSTI